MLVHSITPRSTIDGPGMRTLIHFQGCSIRCEGCANRGMWEFYGGVIKSPLELFDLVSRDSDIEGVTLSGGEPLDQDPTELVIFLQIMQFNKLSVVLYTGYKAGSDKLQGIMAYRGLVDAYVVGPYESNNDPGDRLYGSRNQQLILATDRYGPENFVGRTTEVLLRPDGTYLVRGFPDSDITRQF